MASGFSRRALALLFALSVAAPLSAQPPGQGQGQRPGGAAAAAAPQSIEERTKDLRRLDGFFPLYADENGGRLWMEIPALNTEVLYSTGLATGLGSNDIGLDRGVLTGSRIVHFERAGPRVLMVQPNYRFRASTENETEARRVRDAFARSVLWSFPIGAQTGDRILVDATEFFVGDHNEMAGRLQPGTYRFEANRSSVYFPGTKNFPKNTEIEAELTFVRGTAAAGAPGGGRGGGAGRFFEGVGSVASTAEAASLRVHHSIVELPGPGFQMRPYDARAGFSAVTWDDYSALPGQEMTQRFIRRHRLQKKDPKAAVSEPVEPIVYYLDNGAPEPIRTALLEGARWWNQAFEAAGYRNAFRVELMPEGMDPLDIRYNVINWVHRSTRGWSTGGSVSDPRTGEIIKGVVTLGSLRIRQDFMLAEGLLSPYQQGDENPEGMHKWALDRIRQLSAHEVGHTLGIGHNYYSSDAGRISVMDYPHPLVTLRPDGSIDYSEVYDLAIGEWDKIAIRYGYTDFPPGTNEKAALQAILEEGHKKDLFYLSNQDLGVHARVDQWSNGTNAAAELTRMMDVRRAALSRFGEHSIKTGAPMATIEEVLVPLYLHHRYQLDAAASSIGGLYYGYVFRGDGREPYRHVPAAEQKAALDAMLATIKPSELALPVSLLRLIPPRPGGYGMTRELFPRNTGGSFDAITPAVVAADIAVSNIFNAPRAARLVQQHALDPSLPGLDQVIDQVVEATFGAQTTSAYEAEIARAVQRVVTDNLMSLAGNAAMPQVRAIATHKLREIAERQTRAETASRAHQALLASDIKRFLDRPAPTATTPATPGAPPGAPIGDPGMDWLRRIEPACSVWEWEH
jgi:hypothetical protein